MCWWSMKCSRLNSPKHDEEALLTSWSSTQCCFVYPVTSFPLLAGFLSFLCRWTEVAGVVLEAVIVRCWRWKNYVNEDGRGGGSNFIFSVWKNEWVRWICWVNNGVRMVLVREWKSAPFLFSNAPKTQTWTPSSANLIRAYQTNCTCRKPFLPSGQRCPFLKTTKSLFPF